MAKGELSWANVRRDDCSAETQRLWDAFHEAKAMLELAIGSDAVASGSANEGDTFRFAYARIGQGSVGMAIDTPKAAQRNGFAGLARPRDVREAEAQKLGDYLEARKAQGRRF